MRPSSISTEQRSATSSVRASACSSPGKSRAISSGVLKKNSFVSKRQWPGFLSVSPDWMQRSASCAYASDGVEVVDVAGRHEREARLLREGEQPRVHALLLREAGVLELDVRRVASEDLGEAVEVGPGVLRAILDERSRHASGEASRERDQALRMTLEKLPVHPRLVVVALEVAERAELDEVRVALVRLCEQREVRVPLRLGATVVGDVDLAAENRLHTGLARLAVELDGPGQRAVVGERHGRHLQSRSLLHEGRDPARAVEDRVLRVDVQVNERGCSTTHGRAIVLAPGDRLLGAFFQSADVLRDGPTVHLGGPGPPATSSEGKRLNRPGWCADSSHMVRIETEREAFRERALVLAAELGLDPGAWYLRVLSESRRAGEPADLGALVRAYWELQRVTGRADLRDEWRRLADAFWDSDAA